MKMLLLLLAAPALTAAQEEAATVCNTADLDCLFSDQESFTATPSDCNFGEVRSADCTACMTAADTAGVDSMTCLIPAAPSLDTFCPSGTTLAPDAVAPVIGTCRHLCTDHRDDWGEGHVCSDAELRNSDEIWDESTAQCGV